MRNSWSATSVKLATSGTSVASTAAHAASSPIRSTPSSETAPHSTRPRDSDPSPRSPAHEPEASYEAGSPLSRSPPSPLDGSQNRTDDVTSLAVLLILVDVVDEMRRVPD